MTGATLLERTESSKAVHSQISPDVVLLVLFLYNKT